MPKTAYWLCWQKVISYKVLKATEIHWDFNFDCQQTSLSLSFFRQLHTTKDLWCSCSCLVVVEKPDWLSVMFKKDRLYSCLLGGTTFSPPKHLPWALFLNADMLSSRPKSAHTQNITNRFFIACILDSEWHIAVWLRLCFLGLQSEGLDHRGLQKDQL